MGWVVTEEHAAARGHEKGEQDGSAGDDDGDAADKVGAERSGYPEDHAHHAADQRSDDRLKEYGVRTLRSRAPIATRMSISPVRSVTETSMIFDDGRVLARESGGK